MSKAVYKLNVDFGRQGSLEGVFVADKSHVKTLIDEKIEVYFGEVLGKHSDIYGSIDPGEIEFVSDNEKVVELFESHNLSTGHDPFYETSINFDFEQLNLTDEELEGGRYYDWTIQEIVERIIKNQKEAV